MGGQPATAREISGSMMEVLSPQKQRLVRANWWNSLDLIQIAEAFSCFVKQILHALVV